MGYGTIAADIITGTNGNSISPESSVFRNRIINGAMVIDQRNAGASVTPASGNTYTLDRWVALTDQASKFSVEQTISGVSAPSGFTDYLGVTSLSAYTVASGEQFQIAQFVEGYNVADLGWGTASAKTVTLSFWVRSSLTGTFGGALQNSASDRSYPFSYSISSVNTWEYKTITITGDTSGTWLTTSGRGIKVLLSLGTGSTYLGTAGAWSASNVTSATGETKVLATNGATWYITGVQLEVGSTATSFDYRPYGTELALCQRYCYKYCGSGSYEPTGFNGVASSATRVYTTFNTPTQMRATPTLSFSTLRIDDWSNGYALTAMALDASSSAKVVIAYADIGTSSLTQYRYYSIIAQNSTSAYSILSAEL